MEGSLDPLQQLFNHYSLLSTTQCLWIHNRISYNNSCLWRCCTDLNETIWKGKLKLIDRNYPQLQLINDGQAYASYETSPFKEAKKKNIIWHARNRVFLHTQTRPFKPTAISKDSFFPKASSTGHVGELRSLQTTHNLSCQDLLMLCIDKQN